MEDAASEISDWEVLSAASGHVGDEGDFVVIVSGEGAGGGGGGVLHDHFALGPSPDAGFPGGEGGREWSGPLSDGEGVGLLDGLGSLSAGRLDLFEEDWSEPLPFGGDDGAAGVGSALGAAVPCEAALSGEEMRDEAEVEEEEEDGATRSRGELEFAPGEENLDSDATVGAYLSQFESLEDSDVQLGDGGVAAAGGSSPPETLGIDGAMETLQEEPVQSSWGEPKGLAKDGSLPLVQSLDGRSSLPEAAEVGDAMGTVEEEPVQGNSGNAASGCGEPDGEAKDGYLPPAQAPGVGEGDKQVVVWWRLPFRLLQCCAWKVKPVWSFSIAAALLGIFVLGRRMYRMRRKARGLPHIKIAFDDKKTSQFADRTARLNEAFFVARRIPMLRTTSGAVFPWSMVQER